jgi:hypothetical protein
MQRLGGVGVGVVVVAVEGSGEVAEQKGLMVGERSSRSSRSHLDEAALRAVLKVLSYSGHCKGSLS